MKILVSACLLGHNCKYNGGNNFSDQVLAYTKDHEVIPVCPEVMGGLPVPRIPCEIKDGMVINRDGLSCDREFRAGAREALDIALKEGVDLAILQSRSPSCGVHEIYDGTFSKKLVEGKGIFARMLEENHISMIDVERLEEVMTKEDIFDEKMSPDKAPCKLRFSKRDSDDVETRPEAEPDESGIAFLPLRMYMKVTEYTEGNIHVILNNESGYDMYYGNDYALMRFVEAEEVLKQAEKDQEMPSHMHLQDPSLEEGIASSESEGTKSPESEGTKLPERGGWVIIQPEYEFFWTEEAHLLKDLESVRLTYDLKPYGKLAPGRYKLVKTDLEAEFQIL